MGKCEWAKLPLDIEYHDAEWGVPVHDDIQLFEFLILEGMQAGLSWSTILQKREHMREVFSGFDPVLIAEYDEDYLAKLMLDKGVIRNRLKINSLVLNANAFLKIQNLFGSFNEYIWEFVNYKTIQNSWKSMEDVLSSSTVSDAMSKDLKKRGFKFIGTTICYAFMQAIGMVNDHTTDCTRHSELTL